MQEGCYLAPKETHCWEDGGLDKIGPTDLSLTTSILRVSQGWNRLSGG